MNLSTLSRLPAEPVQMLGKSRRQIAEEAAAEAKRNAPPPGPPPMTSAPQGYEVTAQGGLRRKDQPWIVPETKGRALKAERGDVDPMLQIVDEADEADKRTGSTDASNAVIARYSSDGLPGASSVPPERREECIAALRAIRADDSATCAVPSLDDVYEAAGLADQRNGDRAVDSVIERFTSDGSSCCLDIPADRRADVIEALNALGA